MKTDLFKMIFPVISAALCIYLQTMQCHAFSNTLSFGNKTPKWNVSANPRVKARRCGSPSSFSSLLKMSTIESSPKSSTTDNQDSVSGKGSTFSPKSSSSSAQSAFDSWDYKSHWYPVVWARDVPLNQPIRVTLFDVDYVLAKTTQPKQNDDEEDEVVFYAMIDSCPHKKVALSEGRITDCGTPNKKYFQCAYHGWTFDGKDGTCVEIPQVAIAKKEKGSASATSSANNGESTSKKRREDGTAVAVTEVQGMVWIQPFLSPLEALASTEKGTILPPPTVPELDLPGYKATPVIRDFPIDWTVLLENIMDPDHGMFAHSGGMAGRGFDLYAADGVENVQNIKEEIMQVSSGDDNGSREAGWKVQSMVNAVDKLYAYNNEFRIVATDDGKAAKKTKSKKEEPPRIATTTFVAPSLVYMGRRTSNTTTDELGPAPFVTAFWITPTGTGRSRFMSTAIAKAPFSLPRWMLHSNLNNFLDQDTFLLCGQHRAVLKKEAEGLLEMEKKGTGDNNFASNNVRKSTYVYRSPSELLGMRIGQFFDATLSRVPNRRDGLIAWYNKNQSNDGYLKKSSILFEPWQPREEVLDRYEQHTKICSDSMDVVRNCDNVMQKSKLISLALIFLRVVLRAPSTMVQTQLQNPFTTGVSVTAVKTVASQSLFILGTHATRIGEFLTRGKPFYSILAFAALCHWAASRLKREFFFKFDEDLHRKDVGFIPQNWMDL